MPIESDRGSRRRSKGRGCFDSSQGTKLVPMRCGLPLRTSWAMRLLFFAIHPQTHFGSMASILSPRSDGVLPHSITVVFRSLTFLTVHPILMFRKWSCMSMSRQTKATPPLKYVSESVFFGTNCMYGPAFTTGSSSSGARVALWSAYCPSSRF